MNKQLFKYYVARNGYSTDSFCKTLGISRFSLYKKLNGESFFTVREIVHITHILSLQKQDVWDIFFAGLVDNMYLNDMQCTVDIK